MIVAGWWWLGWTLWIAGANVVIKEALYHYKVRVGRRTGSSAIIAVARSRLWMTVE